MPNCWISASFSLRMISCSDKFDVFINSREDSSLVERQQDLPRFFNLTRIEQFHRVMVQLLFHFLGVDGVILKDLLKPEIVEGRVDQWQLVDVGEPAQVVAAE